MNVSIIGAGEFGLTTAIELRSRGYNVRVYERDSVPSIHASSNDVSKIVRMDYGENEVYSKLAEEAIKRWRKWNGFWSRNLFHETGVLALVSNPMACDCFEKQSYDALEHKGCVERLNGEAIRKRFPIWTDGNFKDGYFNSQAGWVESGEVLRFLSTIARRMGVKIHENCAAESLIIQGNKLVGFEAVNGQKIACDNLIVAAGAWSPKLVPQLRPYMKATGQPVIHLKLPDPHNFTSDKFPVFFADIIDTGFYGFPVTKGNILKIGNHGKGFKYNYGDPLRVTPEMKRMFSMFIKKRLPWLSEVEADYRLCLYCDSWDSNFYIDRVPDINGLMVACGGSGHGFKFAPCMGEIIADIYEKKKTKYAQLFKWREGSFLKETGLAPAVVSRL